MDAWGRKMEVSVKNEEDCLSWMKTPIEMAEWFRSEIGLAASLRQIIPSTWLVRG